MVQPSHPPAPAAPRRCLLPVGLLEPTRSINSRRISNTTSNLLKVGCAAGENKNGLLAKPADRLFKPGSVLLSHCLTAAVSSTLEGLTSVFEMGTGVTSPACPRGIRNEWVSPDQI